MSLVESPRPDRALRDASLTDLKPKKDPRVGVLRELLRHFQSWRAAYESTGVDVLVYEGQEWSLWDLIYLVDHCVPTLPKRQREAIDLCLLLGLREQDVAVLMGINPNNPVASYATNGIKSLLGQIDAGAFPRLRSFGAVA